MKKFLKPFLIVVSSIVGIMIILVGIYLYYELILPDDYGPQYKQEWVSEDGNISFTTMNSKGFYGAHSSGQGTINIDNRSYEFSLGCEGSLLGSHCNVYIYGVCVISGDGVYNPIAQTYTVTYDEVDEKYRDYLPKNQIIFYKKQ